MHIFPINFIGKNTSNHLYLLPLNLEITVILHTEKLAEAIALVLLIKVLCVSCIFEEYNAKLIDGQQSQDILFFIVELHQSVDFCRFKLLCFFVLQVTIHNSNFLANLHKLLIVVGKQHCLHDPRFQLYIAILVR
jgi:hypothetical protein